ncbi:MAG: hypothetical protein H7Z14_02470 [Anaerolineae bacterium]|nr:hypothetical protein [Phycisphaerae bacterium]
MRSTSHTFAVFAWTLACGATTALACLRSTLDERSIQWATAIVEARLESIGEVTDSTQTCTFKVSESFDGSMKPGESFRIVRTFADDAPPSRCPVSLRGKQHGDRFVLLIRHAKAEGQVTIVHMLNRAEFDEAAIADLKSRIVDVRHAEETGTDEAIAAQTAALASAQDAVEAAEAEKTLLQFGPRSIDALTKKLDEPDLTDAGRTRVKRVIAELTPPPEPSEPRD